MTLLSSTQKQTWQLRLDLCPVWVWLHLSMETTKKFVVDKLMWAVLTKSFNKKPMLITVAILIRPYKITNLILVHLFPKKKGAGGDILF